jgi:hypothetical protein
MKLGGKAGGHITKPAHARPPLVPATEGGWTGLPSLAQAQTAAGVTLLRQRSHVRLVSWVWRPDAPPHQPDFRIVRRMDRRERAEEAGTGAMIGGCSRPGTYS